MWKNPASGIALKSLPQRARVLRDLRALLWLSFNKTKHKQEQKVRGQTPSNLRDHYCSCSKVVGEIGTLPNLRLWFGCDKNNSCRNLYGGFFDGHQEKTRNMNIRISENPI